MTDINEIHNSMLEELSDTYRKTPGYPGYDFTRAFAIAAASLHDDLTVAELRGDVRNLREGDLDEYVETHSSLTRKYAERAKVGLTVTAGSGTIVYGDLFSTASGVEFRAIEDTDVSTGDTFMVEALEGGSIGNVEAHTINYMPITLQGIGGVTNESPAEGGADAESDEAFCQRYLYTLRNPANGSNASSYKVWAESVPGVGRARVYPVENGPGTVAVRVLSSDMGVASQDVVQEVQAYIDPNQNGDGSGCAPIGCVCTVGTATAKAINLSLSLTCVSSYAPDAVVDNIKNNVRAYLQSVAFVQNSVSYTKLTGIISATEGVEDFTGFTVNGGSGNVALTDVQVPVLGTVVTR